MFFSKDSPAGAASERFASMLAAAMRTTGVTPTLHHSEANAGEGRPLVDPQTGLYRSDGLVVLRTGAMPATLLEAGIIVNRHDVAY